MNRPSGEIFDWALSNLDSINGDSFFSAVSRTYKSTPPPCFCLENGIYRPFGDQSVGISFSPSKTVSSEPAPVYDLTWICVPLPPAEAKISRVPSGDHAGFQSSVVSVVTRDNTARTTSITQTSRGALGSVISRATRSPFGEIWTSP